MTTARTAPPRIDPARILPDEAAVAAFSVFASLPIWSFESMISSIPLSMVFAKARESSMAFLAARAFLLISCRRSSQASLHHSGWIVLIADAGTPSLQKRCEPASPPLKRTTPWAGCSAGSEFTVRTCSRQPKHGHAQAA